MNELRAVVALACKRLTIDELAAHVNVAGSGFNPKPVIGYEKIDNLYTEADGTKMHGDVRQAFVEYANPIIQDALRSLNASVAE